MGWTWFVGKENSTVTWLFAPPKTDWKKVPVLVAAGSEVQAQLRAVEAAAPDGEGCVTATTAQGSQYFGVCLDFTKPRLLWHETLRKAVSDWVKAVGGLPALSARGLTVDLTLLSAEGQKEVVGALGFLSETFEWKARVFGEAAKKQAKLKKSNLKASIRSTLSSASVEESLKKAGALARANNQVRTWSALPPNVLNPKGFRTELQAFAKKMGLGYEFIGKKALEKLGAGAFLAVIRANPESEGGIVKLSYRPRGAPAGKTAAPVALVGKGLCYDTGGYNIKTGSYMFGMHQDMTGAAVAASYLGYLSEMKAPQAVDTYVAVAENLVSQHGYTPNEIVLAMDGTSIEVVDTDAEGRMVLSDTLAYVRRQKPKLVIDFATLTGAAIRSIGHTRSAVFSNREALGRLAVEAGEKSGERTWLFPIGEEFEQGLESDTADILQCSHESGCDHIFAATFLSRFAGADTPWVHVDLSSQTRKGGLGLIGSENTGFGIRWTESMLSLWERK